MEEEGDAYTRAIACAAAHLQRDIAQHLRKVRPEDHIQIPLK